MNRELLKLLQKALRGELNRTRRRKTGSPWIVGGLTAAVVAISYALHQPKAPPSATAKGAELICAVGGVFDGDTFVANCPEGEVKVRVFGIDAPEMKQEPWGDRSREALRGLLSQRDPVRLRVMDRDQYGRTVAQVFAGERDAGLDMVRQGRATVYAQYNDSPIYRQAQTEAKQARRGIWAKPGAQQDPANWRRLNPR
ncbi:MAG: thermonuclease family protein [Candidatus Competibacteraceae bacterium]|nr:thermonuclease family protein [Candidatus Competibacteraceae bacterium]